jgi:hypothetical protein
MESLEERLRKAEAALAPPVRPLTSAEDIELAKALKAKGYSDRQIGGYFGTSAGTVYRRLDPERYAAQRARWVVNLKKARAKKRQALQRDVKIVRRAEARRLVEATPLGALLRFAGAASGPPLASGAPDAASLQAFEELISRAAGGDPRALAALEKMRSDEGKRHEE